MFHAHDEAANKWVAMHLAKLFGETVGDAGFGATNASGAGAGG